jgi:hypothetical protein
MAALEWNLYFKNDTVCVSITGNEGFEPTVRQTGEMDANIHAAVHCALEVARCLMKGISIKHYFNPTMGEEAAEVWVKCQWMRSGKLFLVSETTKKYHHCMNVEEAMLQKRTFTCTRNLYNLIPKRRPGFKPVAVRRMSRDAESLVSSGNSLTDKDNTDGQTQGS